jgi:predicted transcriptional regulator
MGRSTCQKIDAVFSVIRRPLPAGLLAGLTGEAPHTVDKTLGEMLDAGLLVKDEAGRVSRPETTFLR